MKKVKEEKINVKDFPVWCQNNLVIDMGSPSFDLGPFPGGKHFIQFYNSSFRAVDPDSDGLSKLSKGFKVFTNDGSVSASFDFRDIIGLDVEDGDHIRVSTKNNIFSLEF